MRLERYLAQLVIGVATQTNQDRRAQRRFVILDFRLPQSPRHDCRDNPGAPIAPASRVNVPWPLLLLVVAPLAFPLEAAQPMANDRDHCAAYGESDVVGLGRPEAPVVIRFSGERVIERAPRARPGGG